MHLYCPPREVLDINYFPTRKRKSRGKKFSLFLTQCYSHAVGLFPSLFCSFCHCNCVFVFKISVSRETRRNTIKSGGGGVVLNLCVVEIWFLRGLYVFAFPPLTHTSTLMAVSFVRAQSSVPG